MCGWKTDTIAAISTAVSESGIGIIRISGPDAIHTAEKIFHSAAKDEVLSEAAGYTMHYGYIYDGEDPVDEVLVSVFRAPRSYTAEDTVEINCHGGVYAMRRILETVLKQGVRAADPGEFTKRAFLNGRIDLTRAQAVMDMIRSKNEYALKQSMRVLKGSLYKEISQIRQEILYESARIESALDDPEHYSLDGYSSELEEKINEWKKHLSRLIDSAENGRLIREGIRTAIVGKPNAGKSSLMNTLLGEERAIVTDIAGTTRDILSETMSLQGITLQIMDTAGIRRTADPVEKIGVSRARKSMEEADLVLFVLDTSCPLDDEDSSIMRETGDKKCILLLNKSDLAPLWEEEDVRRMWASVTESPFPCVLSVSAKTEEGMDLLEKTILSLFSFGDLSYNDEITITGVRQKQNLISSRDALMRVEESIHDAMPEDFFTIDLMDACTNLGEITGETAAEDLVNEIFSQFCMGK